MKKFDIFLIFAQNIDCGYTLEPPAEAVRVPTIYVLEPKYEIKVYPCKPQFHYIKVGCKGAFITRTCLHDVFLCMCKKQVLSLQGTIMWCLWCL